MKPLRSSPPTSQHAIPTTPQVADKSCNLYLLFIDLCYSQGHQLQLSRTERRCLGDSLFTERSLFGDVHFKEQIREVEY